MFELFERLSLRSRPGRGLSHRAALGVLAIFVSVSLGAVSSGCGASEDPITCGEGTTLENGECVLVTNGCGAGTVLEGNTCVPSDGACGSGTTFDQATGECMSSAEISCGENTVESSGTCVPADNVGTCEQGTVYDPNTGGCTIPDSICGEGTQRDETSGNCVKSDTICGENATFDDSLGQCVGSGGGGGEDACGADTTYHEATGKCVRGQVFANDCTSPDTLSGRLDQNTVLAADSCFVVTDTVTVPDGVKLTVEEGATVVFENSTGLDVDQGVMKAVGTADNPITFTGANEINGFWKGIRVHDTNSTLNEIKHATIEYAGESAWDYGDEWAAGLTLSDRSSGDVKVSVEDVTVQHSSNYGVYTDSVELVSFQNNTMASNDAAPITLPPAELGVIDDSSSYAGNSDDYIDVWEGSVRTAQTWQMLDVPYRSRGIITIGRDAEVTVDAGTEIQFGTGGGLDVDRGYLRAEGTDSSPILLTGTQNIRGFWKGVRYHDTMSVLNRLEHVTIEYAGESAWGYEDEWAAGLTLSDRSSGDVQISLDNVTVRESDNYGIFVDRDVTINNFANMTVASNKNAPVTIHPNQVGHLDDTSTFSGNDTNYIEVWGGTISRDQSWSNLDVDYQVTGVVEVNSGDQLTVSAGVTAEFTAGAGLENDRGILTMSGTASQPIMLTGAQQVPGIWKGVRYHDTVTALNRMDYVTIDYAGESPWASDEDAAGLVLSARTSGDVSLRISNLTIDHSAGAGVHVYNGPDVTISSCDSVTINNSSPAVSGDVGTWTDACP